MILAGATKRVEGLIFEILAIVYVEGFHVDYLPSGNFFSIPFSFASYVWLGGHRFEERYCYLIT